MLNSEYEEQNSICKRQSCFDITSQLLSVSCSARNPRRSKHRHRSRTSVQLPQENKAKLPSSRPVPFQKHCLQGHCKCQKRTYQRIHRPHLYYIQRKTGKPHPILQNKIQIKYIYIYKRDTTRGTVVKLSKSLKICIQIIQELKNKVGPIFLILVPTCWYTYGNL